MLLGIAIAIMKAVCSANTSPQVLTFLAYNYIPKMPESSKKILALNVGVNPTQQYPYENVLNGNSVVIAKTLGQIVLSITIKLLVIPQSSFQREAQTFPSAPFGS